MATHLFLLACSGYRSGSEGQSNVQNTEMGSEHTLAVIYVKKGEVANSVYHSGAILAWLALSAHLPPMA